MSNEEHLAILRQGVHAWNSWRMRTPGIIPDLSGVELKADSFLEDLFGIDFSQANLEGTKFIGIDLIEADFSDARLDNSVFNNSILVGATLNRVCFEGAEITKTKLNRAKLNYTNLVNTDFSESKLVKASICGASFNGSILRDVDFSESILIGTNFSATDLRGAIFAGANINEANFIGANLIDAQICRTQALGVDFSRANFTGACIEDWHINSSTKLYDIDCQYIYQKNGKQGRCPSDGEFAPGEFSKRFQLTRNIIELTFYNGVPWKAFVKAFDELNIRIFDKCGSEIFLQEYKVLDDGLVALKVSHPSIVSGDRLREVLNQRTYELQRKIAVLEGEVKAKDSTLSIMFERLLSIPKSQINYQIQAGNVRIGENSIMSGDRIINTSGGNYIESNSGTYVQGDYISMSQDLSHAANQIQDLIEQLQTRGLAVDIAQDQVSKDMATQAQTNPTMKNKLLKWGQSLGDSTVNDVVKGVVKLAIRSAGIPLP